MTALTLKDRSGAPVAGDLIDAFSGLLAGKAIRPDAPDYAPARRIWNASIDKRLGLIVRCAGTADVAGRQVRPRQRPACRRPRRRSQCRRLGRCATTAWSSTCRR
jgi:hypothetical protein